MNLGDNILKLRKEKNITQETLAEEVGVSRQTISNWELGETSPTYEQLKLLANALGVDIDILSKGENLLVKKNDSIKNIIIIVLLIIIILLSGILIYLFIDSKNYTKLYNTTKPFNTTIANTSNASLPANTFIRTYKIENIEKVICKPDITGCDDTTFDVTLSQYKGEKVSIQLSNSNLLKKLEKGKTYEFEFRMPGEIAVEKDNIQNIFAFATIVSINETDKIGANQINDQIKY